MLYDTILLQPSIPSYSGNFAKECARAVVFVRSRYVITVSCARDVERRKEIAAVVLELLISFDTVAAATDLVVCWVRS
jgi:hypothetical protein